MCGPLLHASKGPKGPNMCVMMGYRFIGANGPKGPLVARFMGLTAHKPC